MSARTVVSFLVPFSVLLLMGGLLASLLINGGYGDWGIEMFAALAIAGIYVGWRDSLSMREVEG